MRPSTRSARTGCGFAGVTQGGENADLSMADLAPLRPSHIGCRRRTGWPLRFQPTAHDSALRHPACITCHWEVGRLSTPCRIVTYAHRYKRPSRKKKAVAIWPWFSDAVEHHEIGPDGETHPMGSMKTIRALCHPQSRALRPQQRARPYNQHPNSANGRS
jgi:hypothetical protein